MFFLIATLAAEARHARDRRLLERLARGEHDALRLLYEGHGAQVLAVTLRVLRRRAEAEEVVQETFLEAWKRAGEYDPKRAPVHGWLLTIARTRAIDRLRSRETAQRTADAQAAEPSDPGRGGPAPLELVEARQDRQRLQAALATLPAEQRAALDLAYFEGLTHREIAERTATPLGTVKTRILLGMKKLAALLEELPAAETEGTP